MQLLYILFFSFILLGDNVQHMNIMSAQKEIHGKILFVVSNADFYGESNIPASNHFTELVLPYDVLTKAGYKIDFVSPEGGAVPIGYLNTSDPLIKQYIYDCTFMEKLSSTFNPAEIEPSQYQAIYYGGGGAAMFGVANNETLQKIAMEIYIKNEGVISALCHGSIGIANLKNEDGSYLITGRFINGFPDMFENKEGRYFQEFEYSVEALLNKRGAHFKYSEEGWDGYYVTDDRLITGQDPSAAEQVARQIINSLQSRQSNK